MILTRGIDYNKMLVKYMCFTKRLNMVIEDNIKIAKLIDVYGVLLTSKQLDIVSSYYFDNLTISEIADNCEISRQAVNDCLAQSTKILVGYEEKLNLVKKNDNLKVRLNNLKDMSTNEEITNLISDILEMLDE